jgi:hypothetical protein
MSENTFTETTSTGWLSRIGDSIKGILVGLVMIVAAFPILFINEGCAVKTRKTLDQGSKEVVSLESAKVNPANEGKLVHCTGQASAQGELEDPQFHVKAPALKLHRKVEMYQWKEEKDSETKKKLGGGTETVTTYRYTKVWNEGRIDSGTFKKSAEYSNPEPGVKAETWVAKPMVVGDFTLDASLVGQLTNFSPMSLDAPAESKKQEAGTVTSLPDGFRFSGGMYYRGSDPNSPAIGDLRVSFQKIDSPTEVSIIAKQTGNTFEAFTGDSGGNLEILRTGKRSAAAMFEEAQNNNKTRTWIVRVLGFVLMAMGFGMLFKPLSVVADVLPIAGTIVGVGTGIFAFVLAASFSLLTIAIAWIFYRPLIGIPLLIASGVGIFFLIKKVVDYKKSA